jgi:hypothetical protein
MGKRGDIRILRIILRIGAAVFALSAVALAAFPRVFTDLLGLTGSDALDWSMRMIAITLVALTGNMAVVSFRGGPDAVLMSARVMQFSAFGLGAVTLLIPVELNLFTTAYAVIGFAFSGAYTVGLIMSKSTSIGGS